MKVAWFHKFGGPDVLVCEEAPRPAPKPREALVRVRAVGIHDVESRDFFGKVILVP